METLTCRALIVDALNIFIRNYVVSPRLAVNGQPIGGLTGFLYSLQKVIRESKPDAVVICWDGPNGSKRRKEKMKEYKDGRAPIRLNRDVRILTDDEELRNKIWQQSRLMEYLSITPVYQLRVPEIEADDVISYIVNIKMKPWQKVILSADKDFYQLCDDKTVIFRPHEDRVWSKNTIVAEYEIHPENFALARAMVGDKSDNIAGVPQVGWATLKKRLPMLMEPRTIYLNEIKDYCEQEERKELQSKKKAKVQIYSTILNMMDEIKRNYEIIQLYTPNISTRDTEVISATLAEQPTSFNKTQFTKMMVEDGITDLSLTELFRRFNFMGSSLCNK